MPPIPSSLDEETTSLIDNLQRREKDLSSFQVPRLRECKGPLTLQQRYAAEIREDLDAFGQQVETLDMLADDIQRKNERLIVKQLVEEFKASSARIRKDMRAALLHSKKAIDAQLKSNREELFRAAAPIDKNVEEKATDDALMKASNDVTDALRRTIGLMQSELERSVLSHQMLEQSTASLKATSVQHDVLSAITSTSKQLITALEKADWMDRILIFAGLAFFILVVLFILKQRIVDRGLRVAFFWTRFLPKSSGKGSEVLSMQEEGRVTVSSLAEMLSTTLASLTSAVSETSSTIEAESSTSLSDTISEVTSSILSTVSSVLPSPSEAVEHVEL